MPLTRRQPKALESLLGTLSEKVSGWMERLERGDVSLAAWKAGMQRDLATFSSAAYLAGSKRKSLTDAQQTTLAKRVSEQVTFLNGFAKDIAAADGYKDAFTARGQLYAQAIKAPYWAGRTHDLPLPALPGDGSTDCKTRCGCAWSIVTVDAKAGDWDAYWVRHTNDSCVSCRTRAADWSPYEIRGGDET